jgi:hypothetical protein
MSEQELTISAIEAQFENEWVLVGDPETTETLEVVKGKVLYHSHDRDEVYRKAVDLRPKRISKCELTGAECLWGCKAGIAGCDF